MNKPIKWKSLIIEASYFTSAIISLFILISILVNFSNFNKTNDLESLRVHFKGLKKYVNTQMHISDDELRTITNNSIVFLGGSSIVFPDGCKSSNSDTKNFPAKVAKEFKEINFKNLGICGIHSFHIKDLIERIYKLNIYPKSFIIYMGHNDFSTGGRIILNAYSLINSRVVVRNLRYLKINEDFIYKTTYFLNNILEPQLLKIFRLFNPSFLGPKKFKVLNEEIQTHFFKNVKSISRMIKKNNSKLILIPAISNLTYRPFNKNDDYSQGFDEAIQNNNIKKLQKISDLDNWGNDRRIKSSVYKEVKAFKNIKVIDVNYIISNKKNAQLYSDYFSDIFHLNKLGHNFMFKIIKKDILKNPKDYNLTL